MALVFANSGFIAVYAPMKGFEAFRYSNGNAGFEREVTVTQMVIFARKCLPITLTPQQIRNTIRAAGKQLGLVQIGGAIFGCKNNRWRVIA